MDVKTMDGIIASPPPLRVLILEDNPRDAKLMASVLEGGGGRVQFEVTDSQEVFRESLEKAEYDVILADFNLRHWTAVDALDILKRSGKDIPLIVVTGSLGDEAAVECIKRGAADFVLKDRPARLPFTVQRALEEKRLRTENKRAEEALRDSEIQFRRLFEAAKDGILILDADTGEIKDVNPFLSDLLDFPRADLLGKKLWEIGPLQDALLSNTSFEDLQSKGYVRYEDLPMESRSGKRIEVEFVSNVYSVGQLRVIQCNIRDISGRKDAEKHLVQMESRYRGLLEAAPDATVVVNQRGEIVLLNLQAEKQFGYCRDELVGKNVKSIIPEGFAERLVADALRSVEDALAQQIGTGIELAGRRKDGSDFPIEIMLSPLQSTEGILVTAAIRDITERKRAEEALAKRTRELTSSQEALEQKAQELTRSNAELQQFAYITSHDLQEPLRTMASFAQLLQRRYQGKLDANADDFIHFIVDGAKRMQVLINGLLAYSRVGSRGHGFAPIDCAMIFDHAVANLQTSIAENDAVVTRDPLPTVPCDGAQLIQVFQNLIGNSIKFHDSQPPRVHVAAERRPSEWVFSAKDNGIGIDPQYANRIFEVFQRLHNSAQYPGSGIGLAIAKKIVERHGGRIWVESQLDHGATFFFTLPA